MISWPRPVIDRSFLPKFVVICGPTGVGKTGFAIAVARHFNAEVVGADSMQIYRYMDIGTAKPTAQEKASVAHHMVDIIDPDQDFDAAIYARQARACIDNLISNKKLPLVVGGTGLYIKSLIYGLVKGAPADSTIRHQLQLALSQSGLAGMYEQLVQEDPEAARRIHPNDRYRILRALEVHRITGQSICEHHEAHGFRNPRFDVLTLGLTMPREQLYERINRRVDAMLTEGLKDEVQQLLDRGYTAQLKSMQSLGYRHMTAHLRERIPWSQTVETLKRDHRRYAKRQLTWFRAHEGVHWLAPHQTEAAVELIDGFISNSTVCTDSETCPGLD
jgi:tRNA dimethylallyltransferase